MDESPLSPLPELPPIEQSIVDFLDQSSTQFAEPFLVTEELIQQRLAEFEEFSRNELTQIPNTTNDPNRPLEGITHRFTNVVGETGLFLWKGEFEGTRISANQLGLLGYNIHPASAALMQNYVSIACRKNFRDDTWALAGAQVDKTLKAGSREHGTSTVRVTESYGTSLAGIAHPELFYKISNEQDERSTEIHVQLGYNHRDECYQIKVIGYGDPRGSEHCFYYSAERRDQETPAVVDVLLQKLAPKEIE